MNHPVPHYRLDPAGPHLPNVYQLAHAAQAAYGDQRTPSTRGLEAAFPYVRHFDTDDLRAYVAGNATDVIVSIRGSSEEREWMRGIHFDQVPVHKGAAHEGFSRLLDTVWREILASLFDTNATDRHLWLSGHSAGGSMALIAAARLEHDGFEPRMAAVFGAPMVLDKAAAASLQTPVYRVENAEDPVPRVSWPSLTARYEHVGTPIRLMPSGRIAETRHSDHLARRLDRVNTLFEGPHDSGMWRDHRMDEYLRKLSRYADESSPSATRVKQAPDRPR